jgi:anti-sigma regulatory factor (Ser/Thr protein kinase)
MTVGIGEGVAVADPVMRSWPQAAASVGQARRVLRVTLALWGRGDLADELEVVVSELMTNAVQHARGLDGVIGTTYRLLPGVRGVRVEVRDGDPLRRPRVRPMTAEDFGGRGLHLVDELTCHHWGVEAATGGKTVWAELTR